MTGWEEGALTEWGQRPLQEANTEMAKGKEPVMQRYGRRIFKAHGPQPGALGSMWGASKNTNACHSSPRF